MEAADLVKTGHVPAFEDSGPSNPDWILISDASSNAYGGLGAYLLCPYMEARQAVAEAKALYDRHIVPSAQTQGAQRQKQLQVAENAFRKHVKDWAMPKIRTIERLAAETSVSTGSTDMEVKTTVAALRALRLEASEAPVHVLLVTDCHLTGGETDGSTGRAIRKPHWEEFEELRRELERRGGGLQQKKVQGHSSTRDRLAACRLALTGECGRGTAAIEGDWEALLFFPVDMAARRALRGGQLSVNRSAAPRVRGAEARLDAELPGGQAATTAAAPQWLIGPYLAAEADEGEEAWQAFDAVAGGRLEAAFCKGRDTVQLLLHFGAEPRPEPATTWVARLCDMQAYPAGSRRQLRSIRRVPPPGCGAGAAGDEAAGATDGAGQAVEVLED